MGEQLSLDLPAGSARGLAWRRTPKAVGADYELLVDDAPDGTWVRHCGHPTALRPYYVVTPTGAVLDEKFRLLVDAKAAALAARQETTS